MLYCSTRGEEQPRPATRAVLQGLAQDGGLFVPAAPLPRVALEPLLPLDYLQRAAAIIRPFLEEFSEAEMESMVRKAYGGGAFRHPSIAPLHRLDDRLYLLELWHGPTCAFKDMALQFLPHLLNAAAAKTGERATAVILTATSGDTGKAALEGFRDVPGTRVIVFYPEEGVSAIQRQQMVTQEGGNVHVAAVRGNFDDAQAGVKAIFADGALADKLACRGFKFTSANSINWGRLLPQVIYYFSAYLDLLASGTIKAGEKINFVVPTGNFGNILAGYYAARMGLPVGKLICAANQNNVLAEFFQTGLYNRTAPFTAPSPSMDILVSSNLRGCSLSSPAATPRRSRNGCACSRRRGPTRSTLPSSGQWPPSSGQTGPAMMRPSPSLAAPTGNMAICSIRTPPWGRRFTTNTAPPPAMTAGPLSSPRPAPSNLPTASPAPCCRRPNAPAAPPLNCCRSWQRLPERPSPPPCKSWSSCRYGTAPLPAKRKCLKLFLIFSV